MSKQLQKIYKQIRGVFCGRPRGRFCGEAKDTLDKTVASFDGDIELTLDDTTTVLLYCDSKL